MTMMIHDENAARNLIECRQRLGIDRLDEVWDGLYIITKEPDTQHRKVALGLARCLLEPVEDDGLGEVSSGVKVSDREDDWRRNYRCPDVAVHLYKTAAKKFATHWLGGPDFVAEVISKGDRSRRKFGFHAGSGTRELLLIDRNPWVLELYRREDDELRSVGKSNLDVPTPLESSVLPLSFRLVEGRRRPRIMVVHADGSESWRV